MPHHKPLISIVTPVYNEEANIARYYETMTRVLDGLSARYDFEIVFTDNHSTDNTFALLAELAETDSRIRVYRFSRNFGYQRSIWTGYTMARGDAAIEFDCDLQDPPALLASFLAAWEAGSAIVYGVRQKRQEGPVITWLRKRFYRLINRISEHHLPPDAGDFMLIDRVVLDHLKTLTDPNIYLRGAIFSLGYEQTGIPYEREARIAGESKFPFRKMLALAMDGIVSQSVVPLRIAWAAGLGVALLTTLLSGGYIFARLFLDIPMPAGFTTTVVLVLFSISLNAIFLGIIGEYLARIYTQLKGHPVTIIERRIEPGGEDEAADSSDVEAFPSRRHVRR